MSTIYKDQYKGLGELLSMAGEGGDATLLIPDLQRPYVWTPAQVIALMDSLLRGWPFGTLLLWNIGQNDPVRELARPFWTVVDRTDSEGGDHKASASNPPSAFQMVLDGQQRVQSLLVALGGDGWGFKMFDREWREYLENATRRGPRGKDHWSLGCLCVNLEDLDREFGSRKFGVKIDYNKVLQWVVTDSATGQSTIKKPDSYHEPLPIASKAPGRYIRLSRLWTASPKAGKIDQDRAECKATEILKNHGVPEQQCNRYIRPLGRVILDLQDVKAERVTYLELAGFDGDIWKRTDYDDAIVNIFTRLNTGGRILTHEDITFAWLKIGWDKRHTGGRGAQACVDKLKADLKDFGIDISGEDAVAAISFMWAVACRDGGNLLEKKDLLRGDAIRPMASNVSSTWSKITEAITHVSKLIKEHGLRYHTHYASLNSVIYLWAWYYLGITWRDDHHDLKVGGRNTLEQCLNEALKAALDQWLIGSQWAGVWTDSATAAWSKYAADLNATAKTARDVSDPNAAARVMGERLEVNIRDLESRAIDGIAALHAYNRGQVRRYFTALWLWNRLDETRWEKARIVLRKSSKGDAPEPEVDHVVAYDYWASSLAGTGTVDTPGATVPDDEEIRDSVNGIGNCLLLSKSFNISKSKRSLKDLLLEIPPFSTSSSPSVAEEKIKGWTKALELPPSMVERNGSLRELADQFEKRGSRIRKDLEEFIRGQRKRCDL